MAEETTRRTEEPTPPAQVKRPTAGAAPPIPPGTSATPRERTERESVPGDLITKHCAVLKESCEEPADWIAKSPDGAEIPVCDEHKPLVAINYPDIQFEYEEL